jgi:hypothetical protein
MMTRQTASDEDKSIFLVAQGGLHHQSTVHAIALHYVTPTAEL